MKIVHLAADTLQRIVDGRETVPHRLVGASAVAVGTFDGVHLGHRALIAAVRRAAAATPGTDACLFTFRNHPRAVVDQRPPPLLTTWPEKFTLLQRSGVAVLVAADFCPALARLPYDVFVARFLVDMLGMRHLVAGHDLHLGAGRGGSRETMTALAAEYGFQLIVLDPVRLPDGTVVSSSEVRRRLAAGDVTGAARMLGRPYSCRGQVVPGDGIGSRLGFPTANVAPLAPAKLLPASGVYAVWVTVPADVVGPGSGAGVVAETVAPGAELGPDGQPIGPWDRRWVILRGVANHGTAPTVHPGGLPAPRLEVHLLDFAGHLRGRVVEVAFVARLREERRFPGRDALRRQLARDAAEARRLLTTPPVPGGGEKGAA